MAGSKDEEAQDESEKSNLGPRRDYPFSLSCFSSVSSGLLCINLSVLVARRFIFEQFGGAGASSSNADGLEIATTYFGSQLKKVEMLTFMYKILLVLCEFCCISLSCRDCDQIVDCHNNAI